MDTIKMQAGTLTAMQSLMEKLVSKFQEQINLFDRNKIGYNFVFMFASPNYIEVKAIGGERKLPFASLKYSEEYRMIKNSIKKSKIEITFHKIHGTEFNFRRMI